MVKPQTADFISGFLIFLIALPLCMGIAMASGFPAVAGIITTVVGGLLSSFLGSSPLTIKGPAAGLIVIAIAAVTELGNGDMALGYKRCLAVGVIAAILQICFSIFKLGKYAEIMPPSLIHGMLAAIGVIIIAKQMHLLLGVKPEGTTPLHLLAEIPKSFNKLNPEVFAIGIIALAILVILPLLQYSWTQKIPAPLVAILVGVPLAAYFGFNYEHHYFLFHHDYSVGPNYLVSLPNNFFSAITFPDFSYILTFTSLKYVLMFALVGTIESLLTVSAVDSLDPEKKTSDLNKDLLAVGTGNFVAAFLGGLPMISEIVRSKANIENKAKTHWSNFFHGAFLLLFVVAFPNILHMIPLTILAAMLVYIGYKLASPGEFIHSYHIGKDQFFLFFATFATTLLADLLVGVGVGFACKLILHLLRGAPFRNAFKPTLFSSTTNDKTTIEVRGPSLFTNFLSLKQAVLKSKENSNFVEINFSGSKIIDHTTQIKIKDLQRELGIEFLTICGLEQHTNKSKHPEGTKVLVQ